MSNRKLWLTEYYYQNIYFRRELDHKYYLTEILSLFRPII